MKKNIGFVYILYNASYLGVLKIGKTTKEPEERAKELSSATGVATPFVVVYQRRFKNCHKAEELIHKLLTEKGYRISENREFFKLSMTEAINTLIELPDIDDDFQKEHTEDFLGNDDLGRVYYEKGLAYYSGKNNQIINYDEAISNFKKAIDLGYTQAYRCLGNAYRLKNQDSFAIKFLQKGVDSGDYFCYCDLADIYQWSKKYSNEKNVMLAWDNLLIYITNLKLDEVNNIEDYLKNIYSSCFFYLRSMLYNKKNIPLEWENILGRFKSGISDYMDSIGRKFVTTEEKNKISQLIESLPIIL